MLNTPPSWTNTATNINITSQISDVTANNKEPNLLPWPCACLCQWKTFIVFKRWRGRWCQCLVLQRSSTLRKLTSPLEPGKSFTSEPHDSKLNLCSDKMPLIPSRKESSKRSGCAFYTHMTPYQTAGVYGDIIILLYWLHIFSPQESVVTDFTVCSRQWLILCLQPLLCGFQIKFACLGKRTFFSLFLKICAPCMIHCCDLGLLPITIFQFLTVKDRKCNIKIFSSRLKELKEKFAFLHIKPYNKSIHNYQTKKF